jgi:uncharacterized iron-regulated protein
MKHRIHSLIAILIAWLGSAHPLPAASAIRIDATPAALAVIMAERRSVLLGEVHDNGEQHALRVAALRQRIDDGARPALVFEQFDRDRQADIDRVRQESPGDADALIAAVGAKNWEWKHYRPFVQIALDHGLPIVAGNLSRADAMKVAASGWDGVFDASTQATLGLHRLPADFVEAHERAVARGHCDLLPVSALAPMARAQIARDIVLARSLRPYLAEGAVLLSGNGHVRKDIGVPAWLSADERRDVVSIGLLERDPEKAIADAAEHSGQFDVVIETAAAERPDPCAALRKRLQPVARP